jgi:hypothetical protein
MSVILESQAGDELICIEGFSGTPEGVTPSWESSRTFRVGERVRFAGSYLDKNLEDSPAGWMVLFDGPDNRRYAASQTYFVNEACWRGLKTYFAKRLLREPRRGRGTRA